jgi:hypothetical protein
MWGQIVLTVGPPQVNLSKGLVEVSEVMVVFYDFIVSTSKAGGRKCRNNT